MPIKTQDTGLPRRRARHFRDMLLVTLKSIGEDDKPRLRRIAEQLVAKAEAGELPAIKEIADRIDGRPATIADLADPSGPVEITVKWLKD